jgi:hypothetical protein
MLLPPLAAREDNGERTASPSAGPRSPALSGIKATFALSPPSAMVIPAAPPPSAHSSPTSAVAPSDDVGCRLGDVACCISVPLVASAPSTFSSVSGVAVGAESPAATAAPPFSGSAAEGASFSDGSAELI